MRVPSPLYVFQSRDDPYRSGVDPIASLSGNDLSCLASSVSPIQLAPSSDSKPGSSVLSPPGERTPHYSSGFYGFYGFYGLMSQLETDTVVPGRRLLTTLPSGEVGGRPPLSGSYRLPSCNEETFCVSPSLELGSGYGFWTFEPFLYPLAFGTEECLPCKEL